MVTWVWIVKIILFTVVCNC